MNEYQFIADNRVPEIIQQQPQKGRPGFARRPILLIGASLAIGALIAINTAMSRSSDRDLAPVVDEARILTVKTLVAKQDDSWQVHRKYTGSIKARRKSSPGFELAGKLIDLLVDEGDAVTAGQALARLDTEQLDTKRLELVAQQNQTQALLDELIAGPRQEVIEASRSAVDAFAAQVELLKLELARHKQLVTTRAVSVSDYDTVRFNLQSRQAELQQARHRLQELLNGTRKEQIDAQRARVDQLAAAISQIDVQVKKSTMVAPFDGTISSRMVDEGTVVDGGQPVFGLVEDKYLEAWIGIPVKLAGTFQPKEATQIEIDGITFPAIFNSRFPEIDPATQTQTVVFQLPHGAAQHLVDGQVVRVSVQESIDEIGFWLPLTALQKDVRGLWTCFVLQPNDSNGQWIVERRYVEILHNEQDRAFVRGTLNDGDRVISEGGHRVVVGQIVKMTAEYEQEQEEEHENE